MRIIDYLAHLFIYEIIFIVLICICMLVVGLIPKEMQEGFLKPVIGAYYIFLLGAFLIAGWLSHRAAIRRALENDTFLQALNLAIVDLKVYLAFLPIIGPIFDAKKDDETKRIEKMKRNSV